MIGVRDHFKNERTNNKCVGSSSHSHDQSIRVTMDVTASPMDTNDEDEENISSDTNTWPYHDQDIDQSEDEINEINWRYVFQETINSIRDNRLDDGARPLPLENQCKIRIKQLGDTPFTFPLSNALCSRIICEHGKPLSLSNKYEFCGTKVMNSAWQIDRSVIDFPLSFSATIRTSAMEQLHLTSPHIAAHFELNLHKLIIFGPCVQPKIYTFDDQLFIYQATVLVFLPSCHTGGNYRFIDDNDDEDNARRHVFQSNHSKPCILVVPSDCQHEISNIEKGFQLILVYHLVSKSNSINQLYSLLANPTDQTMTMEKIFLSKRLSRVLNYWSNNLARSPSKLLIPLQHPLDYSSYFSILFRDRYRLALELLTTVVQSSSSFLIYSAIVQRDESSGIIPEPRYLLHSFKLLTTTTHEFTLNLPPHLERTFLAHEFLGDLQVYIDTFEQASHHQQLLYNGNQVMRNDLKYHVLVIIPYERQWDLLLDDHPLVYYHLSYMLSLPTHLFDNLSLNFLECILHDRISSNYSFDKLIEYLILLHQRFGTTRRILQLLHLLLQNKHFHEQIFIKRELDSSLNHLVQSFHTCSIFSMEFLDLFREILCLVMPTKLNEIVQFLLQFSHRTLRALFINALIRFIFRIRALPRHILFSTLCSILHLLIVDGSYSIDALLILAYNLIKRVRKTSSDNEILEKYFKLHLIPMLIHIYRQTKSSPSISPAFILVYEYCLNTLNYYCSTPMTSSTPLNIISDNEARLICPCKSCFRLQEFLTDPNASTLFYDFTTSTTSDHCLRHTLSKYPMLSLEYKHDPTTGVEQSLLISKCGYEQEQKQICFHLRRLLYQLHRI